MAVQGTYMLITLHNCSPNDKLFLAGFLFGIAAKMAPRPFAFLFFGGAAPPEDVAEFEAEGLTGSHWAFDVSLGWMTLACNSNSFSSLSAM